MFKFMCGVVVGTLVGFCFGGLIVMSEMYDGEYRG